MAGQAEISSSISIDGLDNPIEIKKTFVDTTAPGIAIQIPDLKQETADVAQVLNIAGIDNIRGIWIFANTGVVSIDTSFDTTFHEEVRVYAGQWTFIPTPSGIVYFKNYTAGSQVTISYCVFGTQN
jgi:hypothetical protein